MLFLMPFDAVSGLHGIFIEMGNITNNVIQDSEGIVFLAPRSGEQVRQCIITAASFSVEKDSLVRTEYQYRIRRFPASTFTGASTEI